MSNVLMVCVDHWPGDLLGCAGHPVIETPTLNQLAGNGVRFTRAYTECPVCIPARRTLMTGTTPRTHGDRVYSDRMLMPEVPTLAQCFRDAGYQAYAVGKLHVYPQRDRIGFDDVVLAEEARYQYGCTDDYQIWLAEQGYPGMEFAHGMCNNDYLARPWHLPETCHVTNWATREMVRMIRRRNPRRPGFFYLSYCHPHPPLAPLSAYFDMYGPEEVAVDRPIVGSWASEPACAALKRRQQQDARYTPRFVRNARRAFYALCTQIDHQLRLVLGTLREEGLLDDTYILFTCDHGDMLGNHRLWAKQVFYEGAANVPMILAGKPLGRFGETDSRLVALRDVMPTLLDLCGLQVPTTVEGMSMVGQTTRDSLYGEIGEGRRATRMMHDGRHKLVYYPEGNVVQLFDLDRDPAEMTDLAQDSAYTDVLEALACQLIAQLYKGDETWASDGRLRGTPAGDVDPAPNYSFSGQRGVHWPPIGRF